MHHIRLIFIVCLSLLITACNSFSKRPSNIPSEKIEAAWHHHEHILEKIEVWELTGRVAVNSGSQGGTATVLWHQYSNGYELEFYGLLGHGRTRLKSTPKETRLYTAEGPQWVAANAQDLLGEYTGWYLPVDYLFYWIRGLPAPETSIQSLALNHQGRLEKLQQAGWDIHYVEYFLVNGVWLPKQITLIHPGNSVHPPLKVKWISKSWLTEF